MNEQNRTGDIVEVEKTKFVTPTAQIFLYENRLFVTFRNQEILVWNAKGELVTRFDASGLLLLLLWWLFTHDENMFA